MQKRRIILDKGQSPGDIVVFSGAVRDLKKAYPEWEIDIRTCCPAVFEANPYLTSLKETAGEPTFEIIAENCQRHDVEVPADAKQYPAVLDGLVRKRLVGCKRVGDRFHYYHSDGFEDSPNGPGFRDDSLLFMVTPQEGTPDPVEMYDVGYRDINNSGWSGRHFSTAYHMELEQLLGVRVPQTDLRPDLHLSDKERSWVNQVEETTGYAGPFWLIAAGHKHDFPVKQWGFERWWKLVDLLQDRVQFVQIGHEAGPNHSQPAFDKRVINLVGKTDLRQLIRLVYHAQGVVCHVSLPMHLAAAFGKPCVVIAGGREAPRWEMYPDHRFLHTNGQLPCCGYDGCWMTGRNPDAGQNKKCKNMVGGDPRCMAMISPEQVAKEIEGYYTGGRLCYA